MPSIASAPATPACVQLLLLAEPSAAQIATDLQAGTLLVARENDILVAAAVIAPGNGRMLELRILAVQPAWQRRGLGRQMVEHVFHYARSHGFREVSVGTGNSSLGPLAFYQKLGFRPHGIVPGYFSGRRPPLFENGLRCLDLVRLVWTDPDNSCAPAASLPTPLAANDPATIVQRQLDAFNARDLDALLGIYADDAELFEHPAKLLARGTAELRERFAARFRETNLHAALRQRVVMDPFVVDHETVTRTFPDGPGTIDLLMTYEVRHDRIARAWTLAGARTLTPTAARS